MNPWSDCPACPRCALPCGTVAGRFTLRCTACGHGWNATVEEMAKAEAADDAWEAEQERQRDIAAEQLRGAR